MSTPWEVRFSNSRQLPYFYNPQTSKSVWEPPAGLSPQQIAVLPGAGQYLGQAQAQQIAQGQGQGGKEGEVRASHILCKHAGSRRPSSWKEVSPSEILISPAHLSNALVNCPERITRTLPAAREIIQHHIDYLRSLPPGDVPREFARIASGDSDCSSAKKGGDLGWFGRGMMQKSFEVSPGA
ncbi:MAG: hypothetical protein TREMPRED_005513 [Tremellales sp. Tagirdzhanova-0007]|nr:MAG: hypothetical protein TREMPRED_005513 [Tremellales sp. Tagirdzhanova-0007]